MSRILAAPTIPDLHAQTRLCDFSFSGQKVSISYHRGATYIVADFRAGLPGRSLVDWSIRLMDRLTAGLLVDSDNNCSGSTLAFSLFSWYTVSSHWDAQWDVQEESRLFDEPAWNCRWMRILLCRIAVLWVLELYQPVCCSWMACFMLMRCVRSILYVLLAGCTAPSGTVPFLTLV